MKLRLDDWMERCLYDPERGYYARKVKTIGKGGDFTTTPLLTASLGKAIAEWITTEWKHHGKKLPIIELGAGTGILSKQVRSSLSWRSKLGLKHGIVEISEGLRSQQESLLGKSVQWFSTAQEALEFHGGQALIFSNEFVDAFPVRVFRKESDDWTELYLIIENGVTKEHWEKPPSLPNSTIFDGEWKDGQRVELHASYHQYLLDTTEVWKMGSLLTIDYGEELSQMYHRRPNGSLRAYFMQERYEDGRIYQNMGRQDLTADVNFSDLMEWGESMGLETTFLKTQSEFLHHIDSTSDLVNEQGAGNAFKVLLQRKKST